jgi:hypothetical protein
VSSLEKPSFNIFSIEHQTFFSFANRLQVATGECTGGVLKLAQTQQKELSRIFPSASA